MRQSCRCSRWPGRSRSWLLNTAGVVALVAVLVAAGRLIRGSLRLPPTTATLPALVVHPTSTIRRRWWPGSGSGSRSMGSLSARTRCGSCAAARSRGSTRHQPGGGQGGSRPAARRGGGAVLGARSVPWRCGWCVVAPPPPTQRVAGSDRSGLPTTADAGSLAAWAGVVLSAALAAAQSSFDATADRCATVSQLKQRKLEPGTTIPAWAPHFTRRLGFRGRYRGARCCGGGGVAPIPGRFTPAS
jgi:hypothetical protein